MDFQRRGFTCVKVAKAFRSLGLFDPRHWQHVRVFKLCCLCESISIVESFELYICTGTVSILEDGLGKIYLRDNLACDMTSCGIPRGKAPILKQPTD